MHHPFPQAANETMMVRKVLYAASSTYYGNQAVPFTETDPFMPTSPYAASKYMGELIMLTNDNLYKLPTLSLRFFMVYGPRNPAQGAYAIVTGKFIDRLKNGQPLIIEGDGQNFRDFVHVNDVARALILGYQSDIHGTSINIGSGEKHSVKEVADLISSNQQHVAARKNDLLGTLADTCRARSTLNFQSRHDFIATMKAWNFWEGLLWLAGLKGCGKWREIKYIETGSFVCGILETLKIHFIKTPN